MITLLKCSLFTTTTVFLRILLSPFLRRGDRAGDKLTDFYRFCKLGKWVFILIRVFNILDNRMIIRSLLFFLNFLSLACSINFEKHGTKNQNLYYSNSYSFIVFQGSFGRQVSQWGWTFLMMEYGWILGILIFHLIMSQMRLCWLCTTYPLKGYQILFWDILCLVPM